MSEPTNELFSAATGYIARMASMNEEQRAAIGQAVSIIVDTIEAKGGVILLACEWKPEHVQLGTHTWGIPTPDFTASLMEHALNNVVKLTPEDGRPLQ